MRCYMPLRLTIGTLEHTYQSLFQSDFRAATESISMASMTKNQVLGIPGHEKGWCN